MRRVCLNAEQSQSREELYKSQWLCLLDGATWYENPSEGIKDVFGMDVSRIVMNNRTVFLAEGVSSE